MNEHSDHRSLNWSLKINSGLTGIRPLAFGMTRRIGRQLYCTFFTLLWHLKSYFDDEKSIPRHLARSSFSRHFSHLLHLGGMYQLLHIPCSWRSHAETFEVVLLQGKCKSAGETKKSKEMHHLKSVPGGELPYERGGDARHLALRSRLGCSGLDTIIFSHKVSFRVAQKEILKNYIFSIRFSYSIHVIKV